MEPLPDFRSADFLLAHMREIMDFYFPICLNHEDGGYYNEYRDDGFITDRVNQHIVSTTRFYRILAPDGRKLSEIKSPAGKTDYHSFGACYEVLSALS